eukprot:scaffold51316_cov30-Phaeocystis_antarctica.AAC.1
MSPRSTPSSVALAALRSLRVKVRVSLPLPQVGDVLVGATYIRFGVWAMARVGARVRVRVRVRVGVRVGVRVRVRARVRVRRAARRRAPGRPRTWLP